MDNTLIVMSGLPGSGKSTLALNLAKNLENYDLHSLLGIKVDFGHKRYRQSKNWEVTEELINRTKNSFGKNRNVIVDSTYTKTKTREVFYDLALKGNNKILVIECFCPEKESKKRMAKRPKNRGIVTEPRNPKAYDKLKVRRESVGEKEIPEGSAWIKYDSDRNIVEEKIVPKGFLKLSDKISKIISQKVIPNLKNQTDL